MTAILLALLAAVPCWAARRAASPPDAAELLRKSLEPAAASYEGSLLVESFAGGAPAAKRVSVRFQKPAFYRREVLGTDGQALQLSVSDGKREWIYDKARNKVWEGEPADPEIKRLGPDEEFDLLMENYAVSAASSSEVAGRLCWILELRARGDGRLRRRLWVDRRSGLTLANEVYRPQGGLAASTRFQRLSFPGRQPRALFKFAPPAGAAVVRRLEPDYLALDEAKSASGMDPRTPRWLPAGYVFESLDVLSRAGRKILHYRFSDGVNVVSLFQRPPGVKLDFGVKSSLAARVAGREATLAWTAEGQALAWDDAEKMGYLLVGSLDAETLLRVAESVR